MNENGDTTTIEYADKRLLSSRSFITFGGGEFAIDLHYDGDHLQLIVEFSSSETEAHREIIETTFPKAGTLKLHFKNFDNALGSHLRIPKEIVAIFPCFPCLISDNRLHKGIKQLFFVAFYYFPNLIHCRRIWYS